MPCQEALLQRLDDGSLVRVAVLRFEGVSHHTQHVVGGELGADQVGQCHVFAGKVFHHITNKRGLAGAGLAGNHDEPFSAPEGIGHIGSGAGVTGVFVTETGVRAESERVCAQIEKFFVHSLSTDCRDEV